MSDKPHYRPAFNIDADPVNADWIKHVHDKEQPVTTNATYSEQALEGVWTIAAGFPVGGFAFTESVKAAIDAGLAYDADPTYWAADRNIGRSAALTELGLEVARERGLLAPCACPGCNREINPAAYEGYCRGCILEGNRRSGWGQWGGWITSEQGTQCYGHYTRTHPTVAAERSRRLLENTPRRGRRSYESQQRYNDALAYIDPQDSRSEEPRGIGH